MTYTFIIEGGTDEQDLSRYHPFYITDSPNGGRLQNTPEQRAVSSLQMLEVKVQVLCVE